jgi:acyl phosphate:glycerol-3-phosphate acyltransferase
MLLKLIVFAFAYLLGSIPTAAWYAKYFHNMDITKHGSGNSGATNSLRVLGKKAGMVVLLFDILKGFLPVFLYHKYFDNPFESFLLGLAVILGHIFSPFLGFRGGKGIASSLGVILAVFPVGAVISLIIFLLVIITTKYVSLGSLLAALSFAIVLSLGNSSTIPLLLVGWALFFLLCFTHRTNIKKLLKGDENKISFGKK